MITKEIKQQIIKDYQLKEGDTGGSPKVQIAILTLQNQRSERRPQKNIRRTTTPEAGLLKMVGQRRNLLAYLKEKMIWRDIELSVIARLGLRK